MAEDEKKKVFSARLPALLAALVVAAVFLALLLPSSGGGDQAWMTSTPSSDWETPPVSSEEESTAAPGDAAVYPQTSSASAIVSTASAPASQPARSDPPAKADSPAPSTKEGGILSDAAILGNSFVEALNAYNLLPQTDCFGRVGLNVRTALTKSTLKGEVPVIDELKGGQYGRIFLVFGENELGWNSADLFIEAYGRLIDEVRQRQPSAKIYIESIFPVSAAVSAENVEQTNNQRIDEFNGRLRQLAADKSVGYVDGASVMRDENGILPADAATDGVHPKVSYYRKWVAYLEDQT